MKTTLVVALVLALSQFTLAQPTYGTLPDGSPILLPGRGTTTPPVTIPAVSNLQTFLNKPMATNITLGESVTVSWDRPAFTPPMTLADRIGLYRVGASDASAIQQSFVTGLVQETSFTPPEVGTYEIRYVRWNGDRVASFGPILVSWPLRVQAELAGRFTGRVTWPTRAGKTSVLYASPDLRRWEVVLSVMGTGGVATAPIIMTGTTFFQVVESR